MLSTCMNTVPVSKTKQMWCVCVCVCFLPSEITKGKRQTSFLSEHWLSGGPIAWGFNWFVAMIESKSSRSLLFLFPQYKNLTTLCWGFFSVSFLTEKKKKRSIPGVVPWLLSKTKESQEISITPIWVCVEQSISSDMSRLCLPSLGRQSSPLSRACFKVPNKS